jgi:hypothetical protein
MTYLQPSTPLDVETHVHHWREFFGGALKADFALDFGLDDSPAHPTNLEIR